MDSAAAGVRRNSGRTPAMYRLRAVTLSGIISRGTPSSSAATAISAT